MKIKLQFVNAIPHILHISAIAGCVLNLFMQFSFTSICITLLVSTIYIIFLYPIKKNILSENLCGKSEDEMQDVTIDKIAEFDKLQQVTSAIKSKVTVIPVLTEQLKAVISQTDSAAEGLIAAFFGINRQSKKQLQSVNELFGNLSQKSGGNTLTETQSELQVLKGNFSAMTNFFGKSIEMITDVVSQLSKVDQFALKIKKIGQMTNILALNAAIEAAQTGEAGNGFKVIAAEINSLSKDSSDSIKEITEITEKLTNNVNLIKQELESVNLEAEKICSQTQNLFEMAMGQIGETLRDATEKMGTITSNAQDLNKEISNIVVSIQFQDITRQRIEHVISPLESLQNEVTGVLQKIENKESVASGPSMNSAESELMIQYTMESEREILRNIQNKSS
jgi:methyl-accepting chemotaxis protein